MSSIFDNNPSVFFLLFWLLITGLLSWLTGWFSLSRKYKFREEAAGSKLESFYFRTMHLNTFAKYSICINITIYENGVRIVPILPLRFLHPPLFFKWENIKDMEMREVLWFNGLSFNVDSHTFTVYGSAAQAMYKYDAPSLDK
ncbi:MAG: hypothetical protein JWO09_1169 [Bacteroidetes bacterium]|nr:hypothetical protein [Bacteroidota bacterium]